MNRKEVPAFIELSKIVADVKALTSAYFLLKDRKNEATEFRFADIRPELSAAFPFSKNGYDYVALTDIDPSLRDTVLKGSPREIYKQARRGRAPALDDRNYTHFREDTPQAVRDFSSQFRAQVSRMRFATLKTRQTIYEHIDNDISHTVRVHVPLITDKMSLVGVREGDTITVKHLEVGKVYFVNTSLPHFVINSSALVDRVHLVINLNSSEDLFD